MTELKIAPVPWFAERDSVWSEESNLVCACYLPETKTADSKLIAAAPDLLEALIEMIELCTFVAPDIESNLIDNAKAAIAKATQ